MSLTGPASHALGSADALRETALRFLTIAADTLRRRLATRAAVTPAVPLAEDPRRDLEALALAPGARMMVVGAGGWNALSYLVADPASITTVDGDRALAARARLKLAAIRQLPSSDAFFRFFGNRRGHAAAYRRFIRFAIDRETRRYWDGRGLLGRRRIATAAAHLPPSLFQRDFEEIRARAGRVKVVENSPAGALSREPSASLDAYVLSDAQARMASLDLNALWFGITRTARPGARVIFHAAVGAAPLPGQVDDHVLSRWAHDGAASAARSLGDAASTRGDFHVYRFNG